MSASYVDLYVIGVQKGATSELCMRLGKLQVPRAGMEKEWHFFERLVEKGQEKDDMEALHQPYMNPNLTALRLRHYKRGFPNADISKPLPLVDSSPTEQRTVVYDATVEYMLSDRAAFLAHALTPHAKIIMTLREPVDRALSQYNMMTRIYNSVRREQGKPDEVATPERFHEIAVKEIAKLETCGYDSKTGLLDRSTSALLKCMHEEARKESFKFDTLLYVTRGLYYIHIKTWREYFPDHRMHFISFGEIAEGRGDIMKDVSDFLCIRHFPQQLLDDIKAKGSSVSFGRQAAERGLSKMGFESYEGKDKYLVDVLPRTRVLLDDFYRPASERLAAMLGKTMF